MSRQNPFMRNTGNPNCDNCHDCDCDNCRDQQQSWDACDEHSDIDKRPCILCPPGPQGPVRDTGAQGPQGIPWGVLGYADFYALMPPDNAATVAPGTDVSFPQNGPISNTNIGRLSASSFSLASIGTYQILFRVGVTEAGQLLLSLNGQDLEYTVAGRATGTSQIVGMAIITTTAVNSILTVRNPAGNAAALTVTPLTGGTRPVSAHLVITQIS